MVSEFDNRIKFPPTPINFVDDVGTTGEAHDNYPEPGQARYDWARLYFLALLAHQSSNDEPAQRRTGTTWFNRVRAAYEYFNGTEFRPLSEGIPVEVTGDSADEVLTLAEWFAIVQAQLASVQPRATWSGSASSATTTIEVPEAVLDEIENNIDNIRPIVYINGLLVDPRNSRFSSGLPVVVELLDGTSLAKNDKYTVMTESFNAFLEDEIVVG